MSLATTYSPPIQPLVQSGRYQEAISVYGGLVSPTPQEDRLIGRAFWGLGDFLQAEIYLRRASKRQENGAAVDLIQLSVVQNKFENIDYEIRQIDTTKLLKKESLQLRYIQGEVLFRNNKLCQAEQMLKEVWFEAQTEKNIGSLVQTIAQSLSTVLHLRGLDNEAIRIIDNSIAGASEIWKSYLNLSKSQILFYLGQYRQSRDLLEKFSENTNPQLRVNRSIVSNLLAFVDQQVEESITGLLSITNCPEAQIDYKSSICRVYFNLIGIIIYKQEYTFARSKFIQFELFAEQQSEKALFAHRKGQYHNALGEYETAIPFLELSQATFADLEWRRELGWTLLQLAYAHAKLGHAAKATTILDSLTDIVSITESSAFLELEKRFIGDLSVLTEVASSYGMLSLQGSSIPSQALFSRPLPDTISFLSLGSPMVSLNGQPISCKLQRSFAVMAYLLIYPQSSLEKILSEVFEDSKDVEAARNYFHTSRYELNQAVPSIKFAYDRFTKSYSVDTGNIPLEFDYNQAMQLLHAPSENEFYQALELCRGPFMRGFEGQWIEEVRANMEWLLVRSGLKLVQEMYESGDFQACRRLTERLLKVEPLDESLNELLVRATGEVEGALASRKAMSKVESQFLHEVGELPPTLAQLKREMKFRVN